MVKGALFIVSNHSASHGPTHSTTISALSHQGWELSSWKAISKSNGSNQWDFFMNKNWYIMHQMDQVQLIEYFLQQFIQVLLLLMVVLGMSMLYKSETYPDYHILAQQKSNKK